MQWTYGVYVIELSLGRKVVYVGQTCWTPEERFRQHRQGYKSSKWPRKYGVRLRPGLWRGYPRYATRKESERAEIKLANALRKRGYTVYSN